MLNKLLMRFRRSEPEADDADENEEQAAVAEPESKQPAGLRLGVFPAAGFAVAALILAGLGLVTYQRFVAATEAGMEQARAAQGEVLAARVAGRAQGLVDVIEAAAADPLLAQAPGDDPEFLARRTQALTAALPGGLQVRLLPPGTDQPDDTLRPRLGYAGLDLVRQAEAGRRPPLEVHLLGAEDQHIAVARAVRHGERTAGVLLASLDVSLLKSWLKGVVPEGGYAELRQQVGDAPLKLAAFGNAGLSSTPPLATVAVPGTSWGLAYWLPAGVAASVAVWPVVLPFVMAGVLLAGVFLALAVIPGRLVHQDLVNLVKHVLNALSRKREQAYTVRLSEFRKAAQALDEQLPKLMPPRRAGAPAAHAPPAPEPSAAPVPDALYLREDVFSLDEAPEKK